MKEEVERMFNWLRDEGYGADVQGVKQRYPFMRSFGQWVQEEIAWKK